MKKLGLFILSLVTFACSSEDSSKLVTINGKLENSKGDTIYLEELSTTSINIKDSAVVDKNGEFEIRVKVPQIGFYRLKTKPNNFLILVLDSLDKVQMKADASNLAQTYTVEGSKNSKLVWELNKHQVNIYNTQDSLQKIYLKYQNNPIADSIGKELENSFNTVLQSFQENVRTFIRKNPTEFASLLGIENLDAEKDFALYQQVEKNLSKRYPNSEYIKSLSRRVSEMNKLNIGTLAPEIRLQDTKRNFFSLSSLKGKIVLIDFWASWCKPCRAENPNVVKLYEKYKGKGFEILGVSLDKDQDAWLKAIEEDKLVWKHVSDLAFWNSIVVQLYNITGIPYTVLIDKEGKIIAKNLRGTELENKLEEILK